MATLWMKRRQVDLERRNGLNNPVTETHSLSAGKTSYPKPTSNSFSSYNTSSTSSSSLKNSSGSMSLMTTSNNESNKNYITVSPKDLHDANSILGSSEGYQDMPQKDMLGSSDTMYHQNDQQYQLPLKDDLYSNTNQQYHLLSQQGMNNSNMYSEGPQFHEMPQGDDMYNSQQYQMPQNEMINSEMYSQQYHQMPQKDSEMYSHTQQYQMPQKGTNNNMSNSQYQKAPLKNFQQKLPSFQAKRESYQARGDAYLPKMKGVKGRIHKNTQWLDKNELKILPAKGDSKDSDLPPGAYYDEPVYYDPESFKKLQPQYDGSNTTSTTSTEESPIMSPPNPPQCKNPHCQCRMG